MKPQNMIKAQGDGVKIQLGQWPGSGPAILCVHGLTANHTCFQTIAGALAGDYQVLAMDLRGRGRSDMPDTGYSIERHCADIAAVIKDLGLKSVILMGHSLGAYISLAFAASHPDLVERLILLDGGAELSMEEWKNVSIGIGPAVERLGIISPSFEDYLAELKKSPTFTPWNQAMEDYFAYEVEEVSGGVRSAVRPQVIAEERGNLARLKPSEYLAGVKCPTLILRATKGMLIPQSLLLPPGAAQRMAQGMADARVVELDGADHYSIMFQPNETRDQAIKEFLAA